MVHRNTESRISAHRTNRARSQAGFSLIEVLIAAALSTSVVLVITSGLFTLVKSTADTRAAQALQLQLDNFAESVSGLRYVPCDVVGGASGAVYADGLSAVVGGWDAPVGVEATIDSVEFWDTHAASPRFVGSCPTDPTGSDPKDQGVQRLSLSVRSAGRVVQAQVVLGASR